MANEKELSAKACPFCGSDGAALVLEEQGEESYIVCEDCGTKGPRVAGCMDDEGYSHEAALVAAATRWNDRGLRGSPLIQSARASGRCVNVTTYTDGASPQRALLLFRRPEEAAECARVLREAMIGDGRVGRG
jgi:hypothetical protein